MSAVQPIASSPSNTEETPSKYAFQSGEEETPGIPISPSTETPTDRNLSGMKRGSISLDAMLDLDHMTTTMTDNRSLKSKVWDFMDKAESSKGAAALAIFIMVLIAISCLNFILETLPSVQINDSALFALTTIEAICTGAFTLEYIIRFFSCPNKFKFVKEFLSIVDLLAIAPFYFEVIQTAMGGTGWVQTSFIRIIRLVRIVRVLKVSRYLTWFRLFGSALAKSGQPLAMLFFIIMICMIFFSSIMFTVERGEWSFEHEIWVKSDNTDEASPYQSIPDAFYWCIITMTTVGYGDVYPATPLGKIIAVAASLLGILVLAIPITVISTNFNAEYESVQKQQEIIRARMMLLKQHFAQKRSGMDALKSEIADLGKRSTSELLGEIHKIVEKSQEILAEELTEIVRIAYLERQKELLRAGFDSEVEAHAALEAHATGAGNVDSENLVKPLKIHTQFRDKSHQNTEKGVESTSSKSASNKTE